MGSAVIFNGSKVKTLKSIVSINGLVDITATSSQIAVPYVSATGYYGEWLGTAIAVSKGGTGATNEASALTNLGGAARGANSDITSLSGLSTPLSVAQGGTGASTAQAARNALLPSQSSNSGKFLTSDGTNVSWASAPAGQWTTSGSDIYYNTGNVGINVTPSAWYNAGNLQVGNFASIYTNSNLGAAEFTSNSYRTGASTFNYISSNYASRYQQYDGTHRWYTAASGTATNAITFGDPKMIIDSSGNVGIGTTPAEKLHVSGGTLITGTATTINTDGLVLDYNSTSKEARMSVGGTSGANGFLTFTTSNEGVEGERMRIDSSGNVGIGVAPSAWYSTYKALQLGSAGAIANAGSTSRYLNNAYLNTSGDFKYLTTAAATQYVQSDGAHIWSYAASGTAGNTASFTEAMRIDSSGNIGISATPSSWGTDYRAIQFGRANTSKYFAVSQLGVGPSNGELTWNAYGSTSAGSGEGGFKYINAGDKAARYSINGEHNFYVAGLATNAGDAISWTHAMRIDSSGNLIAQKNMVVGQGNTAAPDSVFQVQNSYASMRIGYNSTKVSYIDSDTLYFRNSAQNATSMTIDSSGNVGIGVSPKTWSTGSALEVGIYSKLSSSGTNGGTLANNAYYNSGWKYAGANYATQYRTLSGAHTFYTAGVGANAGDAISWTEVFSLDATGKMYALPTYSTTVGGTNRDLYIDNGGLIGYVSSTRASKTNITDMGDVSWLYDLNPVTFNYRKKNKDGSYSSEAQPGIQYGMIAEEVEAINRDLVFYDETKDGKKLAGIQYSKLVPVLVKAVQELKAELAALKG